jgi:hypothetical protein
VTDAPARWEASAIDDLAAPFPVRVYAPTFALAQRALDNDGRPSG